MEMWMVVFVGLFLGCLARVTLPYLRKAKENPDIKFELKYLATFGFNIVVSLIATMLLLPTVQVENGAMVTIFTTAFVTGWGAQDLLNNILST